MKIPFYNILNVFFVGAVAIIASSFILPQETSYIFASIAKVNAGEFLNYALIYLVGLVVNRFGSVVVEPIMIKLGMQYDYQKYCKAAQKDAFLYTLSREYASSRTMLTLFLLLAVMSIFVLNFLLFILFTSIALLFYFSAKKHSEKISDRVKKAENY